MPSKRKSVRKKKTIEEKYREFFTPLPGAAQSVEETLTMPSVLEEIDSYSSANTNSDSPGQLRT